MDQKHIVDNQENSKEVFVPVEAPKVEPILIVRAIVYLIAIINAGAMAIFGTDLNLSVNQEMIYEGVSLLFLVGSFGHAYWQNQNVTKQARKRAEVAKQVLPTKDK